jgi:hypothetical protein
MEKKMNEEMLAKLFNDPQLVTGLREVLINWIKQFVENYLKNIDMTEIWKMLEVSLRKGGVEFLNEFERQVLAMPNGGMNDVLKPVLQTIIVELRKLLLETKPPSPSPVIIG